MMDKDLSAKTHSKVTGRKSARDKGLGLANTVEVLPLDPQLTLDLGIEVEGNVAGIEMGVLENGISFLSQSGLAKMCGVSRTTISALTQEWEENHDSPIQSGTRLGFLKGYLFDNGYTDRKLYIECARGNRIYYAYPEIVCMAVIEFFAFEAKNTIRVASRSFRRLAQFGFREFVYQALHYVPEDKWRYYNDRVSLLRKLASIPDGFFTVFHEIPGLIIDLIHAGVTVNDKTIPDISVGAAWGQYWRDRNMDVLHEPRRTWKHQYPDYYPQAASNPQPVWAYPDSALAEFRQWFKDVYLPQKYPQYILRKYKALKGGKREAERIAGIYKQDGNDPKLLG